MEKQQLVNMERFKTRAKELKSTVTKELEEATLDASSLRRLIHIKNKELRHMRSLAASILTQRTETEQFFLESLQEVRDVIRKERKREEMDSKLLTNRTRTQKGGGGGGVFPSLTGRQQPPPQPVDGRLMATRIDVSKVNIKDLCWEDKELVLRVLFSKMNGSASTSFSAPPPPPDPLVFISEGAGYLEEEEVVHS